MKNSIFAALITGVLSALTVFLLDKAIGDEDSGIELGVAGLIVASIICGFIGYGIFFIIKIAINRSEEKESYSLKTLVWLSMLSFAYFLYEIYPSYYYRSVEDQVATKLIELEDKEKFSALKFLNRPIGKRIGIESESIVQSSMLAKSAMIELPFLTLLAQLHPSTTTSPLIVQVGVMLGIKTEYTDDGVYLNTSRKEGIKISGNLKLDAKKGFNKMFIKSKKAFEQYEKEWGNREVYGGKLCPSKHEHLLVKLSGVCPPITNKMILKFLSKSHGDKWVLVDGKSSRTLLSPENTRTKEGLMSGVMKAVIAMGGPEPIEVSEQKYVLRFFKHENQMTIAINTNFEIIDGDNWIELDQEDIILVENSNIHLSEDWYKHSLVKIRDKKREKLLSANEATLNLVRLSNEGKSITVRHNINLAGFKEAYEAFMSKSVY